MGHKATRFEQSEGTVTVHFEDPDTGKSCGQASADIAIGADGLHSVFRKQLHPGDGAPIYSGVKMWRGAAITPPCLSGASMARAGWLTSGKVVIYPIRDNVDGKGNQLMNWAAELETTDSDATVDWDKKGKLEELHATFGDWKFDWLDVGKMIRDTKNVLETPMVDQEALPFWTKGAVTLLGDAAHPMYPRGSNGAAQAILDADYLANCLGREEDALQALKSYEETRLPATAKVVLTNRKNPPDAIIREVFERTGDKPFDNIEDVISQDELVGIADNYRKIVGINSSLMST
jgi:2-polyprenyl-6-methoxyphenol hydroxylase-like FAD-dependent oxidoreductase